MDELHEDLDDSFASDGGVDVDGQALTGKDVDEGQASESSASTELVMNKIHRPLLIDLLGCS